MTFIPRTINQIFTTTLSEKNNFASLSGLTTSVTDLASLLSEINSGSNVAIWVLWIYINSVSQWVLEQNEQQLINDVEIEKLTASIGNLLWYTQQALLFQYGDILSIDPITYKPYYQIINTGNQIIQNSTAVEQFGYLIIKIRRKISDILSGPEMTAFQSYLHDIKFVGTRIQVINANSDKLKLYFDVYYNSQEPLTNVKSQVEQVINNYVETLQFDSSFKTNKLIDNLQQLTFVNDIQFTTHYHRKDTDISFQPFIWNFNSYAGWSEIDNSYPLSTTISYIAQ